MIRVEIRNECFVHLDSRGRTICGITPETPAAAREKFTALCQQHENLLTGLNDDYYDAIDRNRKMIEDGRKGKKWPIFSQREKFIQKLLDEAGVIDS